MVVAAEMEFCLLGPLLVRYDGTDLTVPRGKQRALLAALLLNPDRTVPVDELAELLWASGPPPSARVTVQNYVMRLRNALGEAGRARIDTRVGGYRIQVGVTELDVTRFAAMLTSAQTAARAGQWTEAAARSAAALALWRGEPLEDVDSEALKLRTARRLTDMRLQALETRIEADLNLGRHAEVVFELSDLTRAEPLREHLHALLMLALYRCGRQADALAAYQAARHTLIEEVGAEPGPELHDLHQKILAADPALAAAKPRGASTSANTAAVPRELPAVPAEFTGRERELASLTHLLDVAGRQGLGTVMISAISGAAGVGKTTLAVYWAHQIAHRFPGGQLYVNLRGFDPSAAPAAPTEAIRRFLDALGVAANLIPPDPVAQAGLYRSLLAGQQLLIVLDNARDEQQVRPLLPASPGCLVIVTSRNQLAGLAATAGARLLTVDVLGEAEARQLLATRLGPARAASDPEAVAEITALCARLPLALAVAAARATARPRFPLAALAAELRHAGGRLDALETGDPAASVRAVLSWSSQQLRPSAARLFRLLGLHPGPDITVGAAASLAGDSPVQAVRDLTELTRSHALTEHAPGRYAFHDLLRVYATEQAQTTYDEPTRRAAVGRSLDHYLHTARTAALLIAPAREQVTFAAPRADITPDPLADSGQALAWFEAEHRVLLACLTLATEAGFEAHAWQLPWTMGGFLTRRGYWDEAGAVQRTALAAATRLGDIAGQAISGRLLASACVASGDYEQAHTCFTDSLTLYQQLGDQVGQALVHQNLSLVAEHRGLHHAALGHAEQALQLFQVIGHRAGEGPALNSVGWCHVLLGHYEQAQGYCRQAIAVNRELGNRNNEAAAWDSLGYAQHCLGELTEAAISYRQALGLAREAGDRFGEAEAIAHLGDNCRADGELREAQEAWQQALSILDDLHHPHADQVRVRLASVSPL